MELGTNSDGRRLTYDAGTGAFAVGGTPVTLAQVLQYDAAGQIGWVNPETGAWVRGLAAPSAADPPANDPPPADARPGGSTAPPPFPSRRPAQASGAPAPDPPAGPASAAPPFPSRAPEDPLEQDPLVQAGWDAFDQALQHYEHRSWRKAVNALYYALPGARLDPQLAREVLDLATVTRKKGDRGLLADCDELIKSAEPLAAPLEDEADEETEMTAKPSPAAPAPAATAAPEAAAPPAPEPLPPTPSTATPSGDLVDQLARLVDLHDAGHLTDEEFRAFKAKLMG